MDKKTITFAVWMTVRGGVEQSRLSFEIDDTWTKIDIEDEMKSLFLKWVLETTSAGYILIE